MRESRARIGPRPPAVGRLRYHDAMLCRAIAILIALTGSLACGSKSDRYCFEVTGAGKNNTRIECHPSKGSCVEAVQKAMSVSRNIDPKNLAEVFYSGCAKMNPKPWCFTFESNKGDAEVCQRDRERCEAWREEVSFRHPTACKQ